MSDPRRALTVVPSIAVIQSGYGPPQKVYYLPLDRPVPFQFVLGDTTTDDGWTALNPSLGNAGRFLDMPEKCLGANITFSAGAATITVGGRKRRRLASGALTQNSTLTLGTTGAREGHELILSLLDSAAYTVAVVNGGPAAGTLATKASGGMRLVHAYFDATNWVLLDSHVVTTS